MIAAGPKRIVVVQTGYIGDVVLTTPLLFGIMEHYPNAAVSIVVGPEKAALAACVPGIDQVISFDKRGDEAGPFGLFRAAAKIRQHHFDLLIAPHRSSRTALLGAIAGIPRRVGFRIGPAGLLFTDRIRIRKEERCRLEQDFDLLRHLGVEPASYQPRLVPPRQSEQYAQEFICSRGLETSRLVGVCIGAHWATKHWPATNVAQFCLKATVLGYSPVLFGGPDESDVEKEVMSALDRLDDGQNTARPKTQVHSCLGNSLVDALALFQRCSLVVGPDSGLTHLARAAGTPAIVLYGPTDQGLHIHQTGSLPLFTDVECRPCHRHGQKRCPLVHHQCMRDLLPDTVVEAMHTLCVNAVQSVVGCNDVQPKASTIND